METLQKRQCYLEKKVEMEKEVAKKNATKNKKGFYFFSPLFLNFIFCNMTCNQLPALFTLQLL
jgi:hypothetical protein